MTSGHAIATLAVFIASIFFVICPVSIPMPRPVPRVSINLTTAPILAIALLWAAQCLDPAVIRDGIVGTEGIKPYNIIILFFSLSYMAITLDITGVLQAAAFWVSNKGGDNGRRLYFYFYVMLTLLSVLLGNDAIILSGTPFLIYYTEATNLRPWAWVMAEFAAANTASTVLFVGNITNVVVCEGFGVNNVAFTAYTILPSIACSVFCFVALAWQYRHQVPPKLDGIILRDPRSALVDPVGACVGSFMFGAMLILCLLVGFFGIEVWMISFPFAFAKFLFDLTWDYYRYSRGILVLGRGLPKAADKERDNSSGGGKCGHMDTSTNHTPSAADESTAVEPHHQAHEIEPEMKHPPPKVGTKKVTTFNQCRSSLDDLHAWLYKRFPTFITALPRLPFALVPFSFSQFILVEALNHQGWVQVFAGWLVRASHRQLHPVIWLVGVLGVALCNVSGTNIGATILLTQVARAAALPYDVNRAAAISLALVSNIGAVSFTFSASLAGLLWRAILRQKQINPKQFDFALWNLLPILAMTSTGLGIVSAEMAVLSHS